MDTEISCGMFIIDIATGMMLIEKPYDEDKWSIPKGLKKDKETDFEAAMRTLKEETGIKYNKLSVERTIELAPRKYLEKEKYLKAYIVYIDEDYAHFHLKCNNFHNNEKGTQIPEVEQYKWVDIKEAMEKLHYLQVEILKLI